MGDRAGSSPTSDTKEARNIGTKVERIISTFGFFICERKTLAKISLLLKRIFFEQYFGTRRIYHKNVELIYNSNVGMSYDF